MVPPRRRRRTLEVPTLPAAAPPLVFNPDFPTILQPDDFSCSIYSVSWVVGSLGSGISSDEVRAEMLGPLVSPDVGLLDASGSTIARLLRDRWSLDAHNQSVISFDEVAARAGQQPLAIGGRGWSGGIGHWVAVRRFENGEIVLANPGGTGPRFGQQRLDRQLFEQLGPFAAVWIEIPIARPVALPEIPFVPAGRFQVVNTEGMGILVRERPFQEGGRRGGVLEGGLVDGAAFAWRQVNTPGASGWIAEAYLVPDGGRFRVANTDGEGVAMRLWPDRAADRLQAFPDGAFLAGEPHAFRQIRTEDGLVGWAADTYLRKVEERAEGDLLGRALELGAALVPENYWDPDGQPNRRARMEQFNAQPFERRRAIFEQAMDAGLSAEAIADPGEREHWKQAMRAITLGGSDFPGECPDLNPFMLAGESGGVFRGGADSLNSSALGYFQFIAQKPIPPGQPFSPEFDYGHWRRFGPFPDDYTRQTDPVAQVRQFIRAIKASNKHHGDPMSVVREKTETKVWGP